VQAFIAALDKEIRRAIGAIGQAQIEQVLEGGLFDIDNPFVQTGIKHVLESVARKTNQTTWLELIELFQEAEREGEGIVMIQERLSAYFGGRKSDWQTERIARTTMTGASNFATDQAWRQSEVVEAKIWISALIPDRTRDSHYIAHGQVVRMGELYTVGGAQLAYPGDPEGPPEVIINCLCVEQAVVKEL
jgi:hypothetical protein